MNIRPSTPIRVAAHAVVFVGDDLISFAGEPLDVAGSVDRLTAALAEIRRMELAVDPNACPCTSPICPKHHVGEVPVTA